MSPSRAFVPARPRAAAVTVFALAAGSLLLLASVVPPVAHGAPAAPQTFHLSQISKLLVGYNGDTDIQAMEIDFLNGGQNLFAGVSVAVYDSVGNPIATLGSFPSNLPNGLTTDFVLCATAKFRDTFGIQPDLVITPGIPVRTGQIAFRDDLGCLVNALAYGKVTVPLNGTTAAPSILPDLAYALVRTVNDAILPSCPLSEDAAARFEFRSGSAASPIAFRNNLRASVNVFSTLTGAETPVPAAPRVLVSPNPFGTTTRIEAPDWGPLTLHDVRGRLVRVLTCRPGGACPARAGRFVGAWDGTDESGKRLPSGIYLLRYEGSNGPVVRRLALVR